MKTQVFNCASNGWQVDAQTKQTSQWERVWQRLSMVSRMPADMTKLVAASWMDFLVMAYVDGVWAHTFKDLSRAE